MAVSGQLVGIGSLKCQATPALSRSGSQGGSVGVEMPAIRSCLHLLCFQFRTGSRSFLAVHNRRSQSEIESLIGNQE